MCVLHHWATIALRLENICIEIIVLQRREEEKVVIQTSLVLPLSFTESSIALEMICELHCSSPFLHLTPRNLQFSGQLKCDLADSHTHLVCL